MYRRTLVLFNAIARYLLNHWTDQHEILYAEPLWPWLGPPPAALRYVLYFWFYG